ncbi:MAG: amylosucrase [Chloroflexota bacterium]|nr:amylosucrase [Chloroflexota bacterium]NOG62755.1 amylosucrase [Chloroflexota bacterium]GIK63037.1 MAG: amylosucrase [Chloroflexota bacterium]
MDKHWLHQQSALTYDRLLPSIQQAIHTLADKQQRVFLDRLQHRLPAILELLIQLYGQQYDFFYHLEQILLTAAKYYVERPNDLKQLDTERLKNPNWFHSEQMVGGVCYVDLFAGNLAGIHSKIPYFKELGLTYLHLMPLFRCPEKNNDGGYAVSSFREVDPKLGTMTELAELAREFRKHGISLVLDFVFNHTSDEHEWALKALAGNSHYQSYYLMFPDRTLPDLYERNLREIFPEQAPGSYTYRPEIEKWVWTTFNTFQWDLNYRNPVVFREMLGEMMFLANQGVEILRLDAVAFTWKEIGTTCENLPQAHMLIQAFYALMQITAPAMEFKSEAIVHPDDVAKYFGMGDFVGQECRISYHPLLMVLLWDALATRKVNMLNYALAKRFAIPTGCAWVNYVRVHDDIGWGFADEDAAQLGMNGYDHRRFLNAFYIGQFEGSFARGLPFNYNPRTGDCRISGMAASLCGIETALDENDEVSLDLAIRRLLLIHSVIISIGGIPLIYLNDEIGMINDYSYENDPFKALDNRWVHRPKADWEQREKRHMAGTLEERIYSRFLQMIQLRKSLPSLAGGKMKLVYTDNPHVLGYLRGVDTAQRVLVLANFSEHPQTPTPNLLAANSLSRNVVDLISGEAPPNDITLAPYQYMWITKRS